MKDTGGPAFPFWCDSNGMANFQGMTLRDYFAAKAMQSLMHTQYVDMTYEGETANLAHEAYMVADAMLAQRNKI
jgi:hypothetical protein